MPIEAETRQASTVARELLDLQQQLGGSIVGRSDILLPVSPDQSKINSPSATSILIKKPNETDRHVQLLRKTAWELEKSAHRLERANLFGQADALRRLAQVLRLDARARLKNTTAKSAIEPAAATDQVKQDRL